MTKTLEHHTGYTETLYEPDDRKHTIHKWNITAIKEINARDAGTYVMLECGCGAFKEIITDNYWPSNKIRLVFG